MPGYYRFPTIHHETVIFVCEDDLWSVPATGGVARRLTANPGSVASPALSPDGAWLAFAGRDEGDPEVFVMPAVGGPATRLTFLGAMISVVGWAPDGQRIVFASDAGQPFARSMRLLTVARAGGEPEQLPTGLALSCSFGPTGGLVIARHTSDIARWKRYRGGLTGDLWIDPDGSGVWRRLIRLPGNLARPLWLGERIYFVADHEGVGNLYSCLPDGTGLHRHTHHADYYVRNPASDGARIVYHAGADLYLFDPATDKSSKLTVEFHSSQTQRKRRFVPAGRFLQAAALSPNGRALATVVRGQAFMMGVWSGPATQHGEQTALRQRLVTWLHDGSRLAVIGDSGGEELLEIHQAAATTPPERLAELDLGHPFTLLASPKRDELALTNQRCELIVVDLATRSARVLDRSRYGPIAGVAWSPDGRWLAYGFAESHQITRIRLCHLETGKVVSATAPLLADTAPAFDPEGNYLYFIGQRDFDPVHDALHFELGFPHGTRPFLITLRADLRSPFEPLPDDQEREETQPGNTSPKQADETKQEPLSDEPLRIDLEGLSERVVAFPVPAGRYRQVMGIRGKVLFSVFPVEGMLSQDENEQPSRGRLEQFNFPTQSQESIVGGIDYFELSADAKTLLYAAGERLRVLKAGEKPEQEDGPPRKSGWVELDRLRVSVDPPAEWAQMYREAWRLQRDNFWSADMSDVDWQAVYQRYLPLIGRVTCRAEFSDLLWEMQGELATSHAYEFGGDYRPTPAYHQGRLAADFRYDEASDGYVVTSIARGDVWDTRASSPLARPGVNVRAGDRLIAVNGQRLRRDLPPGALLVNQADNEVLLTFAGEGGPRNVAVKTLRSEMPARYREWVERNRRTVHEATGGRVGYLHVPDMGPRGYAEFHRGFLAEIVYEALIVDVRFNGGGYVSQLLLEKLARRRIGYDVSRWYEPVPYPAESVAGPIVALTNEQAGSDGDMFSHAFKLFGLGPLIGKRTWGGVVGITVRDTLLDGGITTQPEFSIWFQDVRWGVENYGTDPTIEVDIAPHDYMAGRDPQLERAIAETLRLMQERPAQPPDFGERPRLTLPRLPEL